MTKPRVAILSDKTPVDILKSLETLDINKILLPSTPLIDPIISHHTDMQIFPCGDMVFCHSDIDSNFVDELSKYVNVVICGSGLDKKYPKDIGFNIAFSGEVAFHLPDATPREITEYLKLQNIPLVAVKQGYSKCSTAIINSKNIITADKSINDAALKIGINSLFIEPGFFELPGYDYGFIGGSSGYLGDTFYLTGSIDHHPDSKRIVDFINRAGSNIIYLSEKPAVDIGSIFFI